MTVKEIISIITHTPSDTIIESKELHEFVKKEFNEAYKQAKINHNKDNNMKQKEVNKEVNYSAFKNVNICVLGCSKEEIKAFTDRISAVNGFSILIDKPALELRLSILSHVVVVYDHEITKGSTLPDLHLHFNPEKCESIISQFEKDNEHLTRKPIYTNSKGDEFFKGEVVYWGDTDDCNVYDCKVDNCSIKSWPIWFVEAFFKEDDESTEVFKTEEEAQIALIKKLGKKVEEEEPCMYLLANSLYREIKGWTPLGKASNLGTSNFNYLTISDFAKLVENGVIQ